MCLLCCAVRVVTRIAVCLIVCQLITSAKGVIRDGGIDPANLGKGEWIYQMHHAIAQCNGNVPSVTNVPSLMIYLKNQGVRYIIVKAGTGAELFGVPGFNPQFTSSLVDQAHAAGLWIFGYNRSYATNTSGEVAIANYVFEQGADGFVWDAEAEWESSRIGTQGPALAEAQCSQVRSNWPTKFLAHSPFPIISYHSSFPYKEFGFYCDAVMPQDYWIQIGVTPTYMVQWMTTEYRTWQNSLTGKWVNSKKPIVPAGQGYSSADGTVTSAQITEFVNALRNQVNPATPGGYKGMNYWVCEVHPTEIWGGIRTNDITVFAGAPVIANVSDGNVNSSSATITWTTDQSSDSVVEYGLDTSYGNAVTNSTPIYYHTISLSGLSPYTTYYYRVKSKNSSGLTGTSAVNVFATTAITVADVVVESYLAGPTLNFNPPYVDSQFVGSPSSCKSTAAGLTGPASVRYATGGGGGSPSVTLRPTLAVAGGSYDVYVTHCATSCSADLVATVGQVNCSGLPATTPAFQSSYANSWALVGRVTLNPGVTMPTITFTKSGGTLGASSRMYSDGYKFVYAPPPPTPPVIVTPPPAGQTNVQGSTATFSVVASGSPPLRYQWRHNGANISGAILPTYSKINVQPADAGTYLVVITNDASSVTSSPSVLKVVLPAGIAVQPADATVRMGSNATFSVTATGTPLLSYQWQFDGADIAGATTSSLTIPNAQPANAGPYAVLVTNLYGTAISESASLTVLDPFIATQPQSQAVAASATAHFTVSAGGTLPLSYQWQKGGADLVDGGNISGATTPGLTVANVQAGDVGNYSVVVSNLNGQLVSSNAPLVGQFPPAFLTQPASQKVVADAAALLTAGVAGTGPFTFQWRREGTNLANGGKFSGVATDSLLVSNVQIGECGNYSLVVSNAYGGATSANALLGLWPLAAWGRNDYTQANIPAGLSSVVAVAGGLYHSLAARADGTVAAWGAGATNSGVSPHQGQAMVPGALTNVVEVGGGYYHSLALRSDGTVTAWGAGTNNTGVSPHYGQAMIPNGLSNVVATAAGGYHNLALKADGTILAWGAGTTSTGVSPYYGQAIVPAGLSNVVGVAAGGYHSLVLKADGTVAAWGAGAVNTGSTPHYGQGIVPGGLSNVLMVAAGGYHGLALKSDGTVLAWGDNTYDQTNVPAGLSNVVGIAAERYSSLALKSDGTIVAWGQNQYNQTNTPNSLANVVAIAGGGYHNVALENDGRPYITVQPLSRTVAAGASVNLCAMAVGGQPLNFQWQCNGTNIPGASEAILSLQDVQASSAGSYSVVVTNTVGTTTSSIALLTVPVSSAPHLDSIAALPDGKFELQISGGPGNFAIECAPAPFGWTQLSTLTATGAVFQYIDPETNQASRFYRVRLLP